jgi:hypothetical protein
MNNKKLWYPAAMVIALSVAAGVAQAKSLEQVGVADSQTEPLKNYGVDVSAKSGLKSLMPPGWNLFIYKDTSLPASISWTVGDTWVGALEKFADKNSLAVRMDWSKKAVYLSSPEVAIESRAKMAEIENAARTPLPSYAPATVLAKSALVGAKPDTPALPAKLPEMAKAQVALATSAVAPLKPAVEPVVVPRTPSDVLARALAATAPIAEQRPQAAPAPTPALPASELPFALPTVVAGAASPRAITGSPAVPFEQTPASVLPYLSPAPLAVAEPASDAFVRGNMEDIVRKTAAKLGYQVSWETITLPLNGPVTFLGVDAAEDMRLLQKSLGLRQSPIAIEVYRGSGVIRVTASSSNKEPLAVYDSTYSGLIGYGLKSSTVSTVREPVAQAGGNTAWVDGPSSHTTPVSPAMPKVSTMPAMSTVSAMTPVAVPPVATVEAPKAPVPSLMRLQVARGESLSKAVSEFLKTQGWELKWQVPNDMEADFPFSAEGSSIAQVLGELLPKLGLDTDMYAPSKMVVVRPINHNTAE